MLPIPRLFPGLSSSSGVAGSDRITNNQIINGGGAQLAFLLGRHDPQNGGMNLSLSSALYGDQQVGASFGASGGGLLMLALAGVAVFLLVR